MPVNLMFNTLPDENKLTIFGFLPKKMKIQLQSVSADWLRLLKDNTLWKEGDVKDYANFVERMSSLSNEFQELVWNGTYTLALAEDIKRLCGLNVALRQAELIPLEKAALMPDYPKVFYLDALLSAPYGIQALKENLIIPEQAAAIRSWDYLAALLSSKYGLLALRETIITPEKINTIISVEYCKCLLGRRYGIEALREKHISIEQVNKFPTVRHLKKLLSERGLQALREGLITADEAANMPTAGHLKDLLDENGLKALRLKLITLEKAASFYVLGEQGLAGYIIGLLDVHTNTNSLTKHGMGK